MTIHDILSRMDGIEIEKEQPHTIHTRVDRTALASLVTALVNTHGLRLASLYAIDDREKSRCFTLHTLLAFDADHAWLALESPIPADDPSYPSITPTVMAAHWYERYMADMFGIMPVGHPDLRRLVHHENVPRGTHPLRKDFAWNSVMAHADEPYPMHHVSGEGVFEIPVGPIHAGIIEPGHFRFNVLGERIITLEGKLFFTHKGVEKLLEEKTVEEAIPFIERISGDSAASHALAFSSAVESVAGCIVPERAQKIRTIVCELERLTMHIHDLSNIAGNGTGYTVMAANGFRIKERLMRLSTDVCNNRFWRGLIVPGGLAADLSQQRCSLIQTVATEAVSEMEGLLAIALHSDGLRERLETTGILSKEGAIAFGGLGLPVRASGVPIDVRQDHPYAAYKEIPFALATETAGDVFARFSLRIAEMRQSLDIIIGLLSSMTDGPIRVDCHPVSGWGMGAVESWRGEILTAVHIEDGRITRCFPRDPSFANWPLFGLIGPSNIIPDFPLCNKSLNLSYSGTDL